MSDATTPEPLRRELTARGVWGLAINGTIGAGIFGLPAAAAAQAGVWSPLLFLLCGLLLAPVVLSFAEVASAFRGTGGPVLYTRTAFGAFAGFQTGWAFYVTRVSASAANLSLIVAALGAYWPAAGRAGGLRVALLAACCALLVWVNVAGTRHAMRAIGALTLLKFLPLLAVVAAGWPRVDAAAFPSAATPVPSPAAVGTGVLLVIYAFVGWESAVVPGGETREPRRDMPRALLWALAVATLLYVLIQVVCVATLPALADTGARPLVAVGEVLFGPVGALLLTIGVVVSVAGNVASAALSTPRITYALARDGLLPRPFGAVHPRHRTPAISIAVYGALTFVLAASGTFVELAEISVLTRLLIYLAVVLAVPLLRRRGMAGGLRLPGGPTVPLLATAVCIVLLLQVGRDTVLRTALYLAVGSLLYLVAGRGRRGASAA